MPNTWPFSSMPVAVLLNGYVQFAIAGTATSGRVPELHGEPGARVLDRHPCPLRGPASHLSWSFRMSVFTRLPSGAYVITTVSISNDCGCGERAPAKSNVCRRIESSGRFGSPAARTDRIADHCQSPILSGFCAFSWFSYLQIRCGSSVSRRSPAPCTAGSGRTTHPLSFRLCGRAAGQGPRRRPSNR